MIELLSLVGLILSLVVAYTLGGFSAIDFMQDDAVKHNHAEYYIDSGNEKKWRWK